MPPILDVTIGVVFVFLLFSLVVTAANEIWLSILDKRAAFLKQGLEELLNDSDKINATALLNHGLIASLSKGKYVPTPLGKQPGFLKQILIGVLPASLCKQLKLTTGTEGVPSYIPGKSFVMALIALVQTHGTAAAASGDTNKASTAESGSQALIPVQAAGNALLVAPQNDMQTLGAALSRLPDSKLRQSLLALYQDAAGDICDFKANVENWFNESMDRVGGWYKRYAQQWLLALAFALAVGCNVNTVQLVQSLSQSPKLTESLVKQATAYAENHRTSAAVSQDKKGAATEQKSKPAGDTAATAGTATTTGTESASTATAAKSKRTESTQANSTDPTPLEEANKSPEIAHFKAALGALQSTGIPIGWSPEQRLYFQNADGEILLSQVLTALAGWIVTALAASLGAPFWFDTLNRFIDLRGVGRAPEEKDPTAPKKKATGAETYLQTGDALPAQK